MSNILMDSDEPEDDGWTDFLSQPMAPLIGQSDTQLGENAPTGFRDRYTLAMSFVYLLSVAVVVGLGFFAVSQWTGGSQDAPVASTGETPAEVAPDSGPVTPPAEETPAEVVPDPDPATPPAAEAPAVTTSTEAPPVTTTTEPPVTTTEPPVTDPDIEGGPVRYEFVVQTDDDEGPFWYVLDNQEMTRLWAADCLSDLGEPEREIVWAELSTFLESPDFTECDELVALTESGLLVDLELAQEPFDPARYEFVVQTDDEDGPFWYVLDNEENTRLWAAECLADLGEPEREILWDELMNFDEPAAFTECEQLVPLVQDR